MGIQITRRTFLAGVAGFAALAGTACASPQSSNVSTSAAGAAQGKTVLDSFDLYCDTIDALGMANHQPYASNEQKNTGTLKSNDTQVSADRITNARWIQCYGIWIPPTEGENATDMKPIQWYREAAKWFHNQMETCDDRFAQVRDFSQVSAILEEGKIPAILTVENASCLEEGASVVDEFAKDGVLIAGLTWNGKNALGSGTDDPDVGLTDLGKDFIAALEAHNITLDASHLNDLCFWNLDALASKPYIATHSNSRAVCNQLRNLTDDQFQAIAQRGGVVGLNLHKPFVHDGNSDYTFDELAKHIDHWLDLSGEDAIALGSNRDGAEIPDWVADCSKQAALYEQFCDRIGISVAHKLFYDNAMRFFGAR